MRVRKRKEKRKEEGKVQLLRSGNEKRIYGATIGENLKKDLRCDVKSNVIVKSFIWQLFLSSLK